MSLNRWDKTQSPHWKICNSCYSEEETFKLNYDEVECYSCIKQQFMASKCSNFECNWKKVCS